MAEETVLQVELDGVTYALRSNTDTARLQQTADLVAQKLAAVRGQNPHYSATRAAMLVALQLAEDMLALQDEYLELLEEADIGGKA